MSFFNWRTQIKIILAMMLGGYISLWFVDYHDIVQIGGYPAIFIIVAWLTASLILPVPPVTVVGFAANFFDPSLVALWAALGAVAGEQNCYNTGKATKLNPQGRIARIATDLLGKQHAMVYTMAGIAFLCCLPIPGIDIIGVLAGAVGYNRWIFSAACFLGKLAKFGLFAYFGHQLGEWIWSLLLAWFPLFHNFVY